MISLLYLPSLLQGLTIGIDEILFHRRRGLDTWEVWGHPLDTVSVAIAYAFLWAASPSQANMAIFASLATFSSLFVTKDEFIHAELCEPGEHWLHSILFILHPTAFAAAGLLWYRGGGAWLIAVQLVLLSLFLSYQVIYWGIPWARSHYRKSTTQSTKHTAIDGIRRTTIQSRS